MNEYVVIFVIDLVMIVLYNLSWGVVFLLLNFFMFIEIFFYIMFILEMRRKFVCYIFGNCLDYYIYNKLFIIYLLIL